MMRPSRLLILGLLVFLWSSALTAEADESESWDVNNIPGTPRDISIDTTSGTWMSLDVSPDGRTIAFDLLGDIYTLPIAGGDARAINSGLSWSMQPRFSPDGSEIAFISDAGGADNVWIMQADGNDAVQLTEEDFRLLNNPTWSADGDYIAARKHFTTERSLGTGEIWLYHRDGGDGIAVVEKPDEEHQKELGEPMFSADGRYIYYSLDVTPGSTFQYAQDSNGVVFEIRRYDMQTGKIETVVDRPGGAVRPQPSPDGKTLAYVRRHDGTSSLVIRNLQSGADKILFEGLDYDLQEVWGVHGLYPNFDWMPDSSGLVFWTGGGIKRVDAASGAVRDIPFRVRDSRRVYEPPRPVIDVAPDSFQTKMVRNAAVSPDGGRVVFESGGRLYIKSLPNGDEKLLTRDAGDQFEFFPSWSRDGRSIAFVSWTDAGLSHVHTVRASGGRSAQLTKQPGHYRSPRFSPDGDKVVFAANSGGYLTSPDWSVATGVFIVPAGGGDATMITDDGSDPQFAAAADRLFVTRYEDGKRALVSIDLAGETPRTHAAGEYLTEFDVAPDGRHLAFRENYHVYVLPLPPGGNPLELGTSVGSLQMTRASGDGGNWPHWSGDSKTLHWSLGANLYGAKIDALFAVETEEGEGGYLPPASGVSLSMQRTADKPDSVVALTGATIITMAAADGGVIENGVIVTDGNRIAAVGSRDSVTIPADAEIVDVSGRTIIPGLIDAHAHGPQGADIIPQQNWSAYATLALGVTTVHDPSNDATEVFAASEMQRTGAILAPRIFSTGDIVYGARSSYFAKIDSADEAREHVRRLKAQGAISIKNYNQPRRNQRQQVTAAAREEGMLVVSEGGSLFHMDLSMVADGNSAIEHNLPQSTLYDDVLQFWSQTQVAYTPTLVVVYGGIRGEDYWYQHSNVWQHPILSRFVPPDVLRPRSVRRQMAPDSEYYHPRVAEGAKALADRGVMVSIGAHGQREGLASHWEMWNFASGGMSPVEALRTATTAPAAALGFAKDLGSIEAGKLADLAVINGNVLEDIYQSDNVEQVMLNGRLYDAATLNETVTGERRTQPFYWQR
ncbi:MAG: PD40 domain-containing protein [Woeseia sp.]|nr:PD40 domain-containing protein [Woeseia sp.]